MSSNTQDAFDQTPYDQLTLVGKEDGDYGSTEYIYRGDLGTYRLRIGQSITDKNGKVLYFYQNNALFLTLYPTRTRMVFTGKDEDGLIYLFRFDGKDVRIITRKYDV